MRIVSLAAMLAIACAASYSCTKPTDDQGNDTTKPTSDTRLSDCTISEIEFEGQTETPVISIDGDVATIDFKIDPSRVDMRAVKITKLTFRYSDPAYIPSSSVNAGETLNLDKQSADIVVTSHNGEKVCTYTVTATSDIVFTVDNPFQGTVTFDLIGGIPFGNGQSFLVFIGGNGDESKPEECDIRMTTDADIGDGIHSHVEDQDNREKDNRAMTLAEQDNIISFKYTEVDPSDGTTYGTYVNDAGPDGKYSDFIYFAFDQASRADDPLIDISSLFRLLPQGKMLWSQAYNSDVIRFYEYDDTEHTTVVSEVTLMTKDDNFVFPYANYSQTQWMSPEEVEAGKHITIPVEHYAFNRHYAWDQWWAQLYPDEYNSEEEWSDTRYCVSNVRDIFWLVDISPEPVSNHDGLLDDN